VEHIFGIIISAKNDTKSIGLEGGTYFWYHYFSKKSFLKKFDYTMDYPIGTLFLRKYRNVEDQGHVAVLYSKYNKDPSKILYGNIIHAYADDDGGQVGITNLGFSHFIDPDLKEGYYEFAVLPQHWLN